MEKAVEIMYADGSIAVYSMWQWELFKDGIIENLYNKGLCDIRYINEDAKTNTDDADGDTTRA